MLIITLVGVIGGFLMNIIVRDPRKTFCFDMLIQWIILQMYYGFSQIFNDSYSIVEPGFEIILFVILSIIMLFQIFAFGVLSYKKEPVVLDTASQPQNIVQGNNIPSNPMNEKPWWENH